MSIRFAEKPQKIALYTDSLRESVGNDFFTKKPQKLHWLKIQ